MKVWLTRHTDVENVVWVQYDSNLFSLTRSGDILHYTHSEHNTYVIRLLTEHTDDWVLL